MKPAVHFLLSTHLSEARPSRFVRRGGSDGDTASDLLGRESQGGFAAEA
jgi:hypothetical protein